MASKQFQPYWQGELDGLCGIYSVINAIRWALHTLRKANVYRRHRLRALTTDECHALYSALLVCLILHHETARPAIDGLNSRDLAGLLRRGAAFLAECRSLRLTVVRPFHRRRRVPLPELRRVLAVHVGKPGTAAIVGMNPPWSHWTVISAVTKTRLLLLDSGGNRHLPLSRRDGSDSGHASAIHPPMVYLLTVGSLVRRPIKRTSS